MSTPINDFVKSYSESHIVRFHMPGHKGQALHGMERLDITEIKGADYLYEADGIIAESERQTAAMFGSAATFYSTEGSTHCIKSMLGILRLAKGRPLTAIAPRNVHKAFIDACILLDINVKWVYPKGKVTSLCAGEVEAEDIKTAVENFSADFVYITSPTYLGKISPVKEIAQVCHEKNIPLIIDNAHGAYLNFLEENIHPMALGADMCCDSAHKTLPCYTGGAYLHISNDAPKEYSALAKQAMSMFGSTSPSYLTMQSLDICCGYLQKDFPEELAKTVRRIEVCKKRLEGFGWKLYGDEPMKITVACGESGIDGNVFGDMLRRFKIEPEYTDKYYAVLMPSPFNGEEDFLRLENAMNNIPQGKRSQTSEDIIPKAVVKMGIRQAALSPNRRVAAENAAGNICGLTVTSCQPSVPVVISGEEITPQVVKILKSYSISYVNVL